MPTAPAAAAGTAPAERAPAVALVRGEVDCPTDDGPCVAEVSVHPSLGTQEPPTQVSQGPQPHLSPQQLLLGGQIVPAALLQQLKSFGMQMGPHGRSPLGQVSNVCCDAPRIGWDEASPEAMAGVVVTATSSTRPPSAATVAREKKQAQRVAIRIVCSLGMVCIARKIPRVRPFPGPLPTHLSRTE
jgi:hypothetical protein